MKSLNDMKVGDNAVIRDISNEDPNLLIELQELGMVPGTEVTCLARGPFGTPRAYSFRGTTFALRPHEAEAVLI